MLVLSRRVKQKFLFPHLGIKISILGTSGKAVRLGIDAPQNVRVIREELGQALDDIEAFNQSTTEMQWMTSQERHDFRNFSVTRRLICRYPF